MCLESCLPSIPVMIYFIKPVFSLLVLNSKPDIISSCFTAGSPAGPVNQGGCLPDSRLLMGNPFVPWDNSFSDGYNFIFVFHWHFALFLKLLNILQASRDALPHMGLSHWVLDMALLFLIIHIHSGLSTTQTCL